MNESATSLHFNCVLEALICVHFGMVFVPDISVYMKPTKQREEGSWSLLKANDLS